MRTALILLVALWMLALSAKAEVPHIFQPGQIISSEQMNENFAALENGGAGSEDPYGYNSGCNDESFDPATLPFTSKPVLVMVTGTCVVDNLNFSGSFDITFEGTRDDSNPTIVVSGSVGIYQAAQVRLQNLTLSVQGRIEVRRRGTFVIEEGSTVEVGDVIDFRNASLFMGEGTTLAVSGNSYGGIEMSGAHVDIREATIEAPDTNWYANYSNLLIENSAVQANIAGNFGTRMIFQGTHWSGGIFQEGGYLSYRCESNGGPIILGARCGETTLRLEAWHSQVQINLPPNQQGEINFNQITGTIRGCGTNIRGNDWASVAIWNYPDDSTECSGPLTLELQNSVVTWDDSPMVSVENYWNGRNSVLELVNGSAP